MKSFCILTIFCFQIHLYSLIFSPRTVCAIMSGGATIVSLRSTNSHEVPSKITGKGRINNHLPRSMWTAIATIQIAEVHSEKKNQKHCERRRSVCRPRIFESPCGIIIVASNQFLSIVYTRRTHEILSLNSLSVHKKNGTAPGTWLLEIDVPKN